MRFPVKWTAGCTAAAIAALLWPAPAHADTTLGGYQAIAEAAVVHIEVFEPTIPIPATPQGDFSIGYTKSNADTGPTTRALASYLWPGVVLGDGFDQLFPSAKSGYPIQVNSRFPATNSAPAKNSEQISDGNGMATSSDGDITKANVTGLGVAGPNTSLLTGVGAGLNQLTGKPPTAQNAGKNLVPVSVAKSIAALVSTSAITSESTVTVAAKTVTSDAHASVAAVSLLGGLIKINGLDVHTTIVSDGAKATTSGDATVGSLTIAGLRIPISNKGNSIALPQLSKALTDVLSTLGLGLSVVPVTESTTGPQGSMTAQALQLTIDTHPLKAVLDNILNPLIAMFPAHMTQNLQPILALGPKIVLTIGTADATATASPAFNLGGFPTGGGVPGSTGGGLGTSGQGTGGTSTGTFGTSPGQQSTPPAQTGTNLPTMTTVPTAAKAFPALGKVPRFLILGAIALAALIGWLITTSAGFLFGAAGTCGYGLSTGVPDLRKG